MAYATAEEVAEYAGVSPDEVKLEALEAIASRIDAWRGNLYPQDEEPFTEILDGPCRSRYLFLTHTDVDSITSVEESGATVDSGDYALMHGSIVARVDGQYWTTGIMNIEVTGVLKEFSAWLRAATCEIWNLGYTREKLSGLLRTYPSRQREYTDGGGAVTGYDSLEQSIMDVLKALLPKPARIS